jgi:hypothetical protein
VIYEDEGDTEVLTDYDDLVADGVFKRFWSLGVFVLNLAHNGMRKESARSSDLYTLRLWESGQSIIWE